MRRWTILALMAFMLIMAAVAGVAGADRKNSNEPDLVAYTTLPPETVLILAQAYERATHVRISFVPLPAKDLLEKLSTERTADVILTDSEVLKTAAGMNQLTPHISETNDAVKIDFKDERDRWIGVWYDPIIFCANKDYLRTLYEIPDTWRDLAASRKVRIGITDFLAADASSNLMFQLIENLGESATYEILDGIHPKVVQYTKFLSNPVRQAGMGEADISIAVESETLRYIQDNYPLKIIYPADGTSYILTGVGITATDSKKVRAAENFADWLLTDDAHIALQSNGFYFISTNPGTLAYKTFAGKNLVLFDRAQNFTAQQREEFLDRWVKEVRLK